ncbi:TPA: O-antigen ligase family protein [Photobacterium damselae]
MTRDRQLMIAILLSLAITIGWYFEPLPAIALCLLPLLPWLLTNAFYLCVGFILFSYFRIHEAFPVLIPFKIPQLLALLSLLGLGWQLWLQKAQLHYHPLLAKFLAFVLWVILCCALGTNRAESFSTLIDSFSKIIIMVFAISWLPQSVKQLNEIPTLLIISGLAIAVIALDNKYHGIGLVEETRVTIGRDIGSMLGDPNDLSLILLFPFSFCLARFFSVRAWHKIIYLISGGMLLAGIVITESRGGLLGITSAILTISYIKSRSKVLPLILSGGGLLLLALVAGISDRVSGGAHESGIDESAMGRLFAWKAAFKMALAHPITGVGLTNYYNNYFFFTSYWDGKNHAVHSSWFEILAENGFIGLFLFVALITATLKVTHYLRLHYQQTPYQSLAEGLWIGLISFCVSGTFLTQGMTWPFYILLGLIMALDRLTPSSKHQES